MLQPAGNDFHVDDGRKLIWIHAECSGINKASGGLILPISLKTGRFLPISGAGLVTKRAEGMARVKEKRIMVSDC